jgi:iron complex transport system ATP-binding protein
MTKAIDIRALSYRAGGKTILRRLTLHAAVKEHLGIIGPNGAGKSTLLKCLMRINRAEERSVRILGRPLEAYSQRELAREMSYVPQAADRTPKCTVREFVAMGRFAHLGPFASMSDRDRRAVDEALTLTGASTLADQRLGTLSGGERQSVYIAGAVAQ